MCALLMVLGFDLWLHVGAVRVLYLIPVWLAVRLGGRRPGVTIAAIVVAAMLVEDLSRRSQASVGMTLLETAFRVLSFSGVAWLIASLEFRLADTEQLALRDPLTGIFNRRALSEFWNVKISQDPSSNAYVVVMIDCDGFKRVNDRYGHEAGDRVLQILGKVLESETRRGDLAARVGGDEFVLILKETAPAEAKHILRRIESVFEYNVESAGYACSLSVGYAPVESAGQSMEDLLAKADQEMYRHKEMKRAAAFLN